MKLKDLIPVLDCSATFRVYEQIDSNQSKYLFETGTLSVLEYFSDREVVLITPSVAFNNTIIITLKSEEIKDGK
jgi:hypothetical protein